MKYTILLVVFISFTFTFKTNLGKYKAQQTPKTITISKYDKSQNKNLKIELETFNIEYTRQQNNFLTITASKEVNILEPFLKNTANLYSYIFRRHHRTHTENIRK
jgi:hypothetical protein